MTQGGADAQRDERGAARLVRRRLRRPASTRWNRILERHGMSDRLRLPDRKFNRGIGMYSRLPLRSERRAAVERGVGAPQARVAAVAGRHASTCSASWRKPVYEPGKFANYIAPPRRGINQQPIDFEYVRTEQ